MLNFLATKPLTSVENHFLTHADTMSPYVQVFGRPPPERLDALGIPASENLHKSGLGALFDHHVGAAISAGELSPVPSPNVADVTQKAAL